MNNNVESDTQLSYGELRRNQHVKICISHEVVKQKKGFTRAFLVKFWNSCTKKRAVIVKTGYIDRTTVARVRYIYGIDCRLNRVQTEITC
jgi:hypothetical protein